MKHNIVKEKSYDFALRIIKLSNYLKGKIDRSIIVQVLKSGTSVGANIEEAVGGQSKADFKSKISIAYKEARESRYWLLLLRDSGTITNEMHKSIGGDCEEICKLLAKTLITLKEKDNK